MTSSRISQPRGWPRMNITESATAAGSLRFASEPGLYFGSRSSKKCVFMPEGISVVTPTSPFVSAASARVKPSTPNLEAQ